MRLCASGVVEVLAWRVLDRCLQARAVPLDGPGRRAARLSSACARPRVHVACYARCVSEGARPRETGRGRLSVARRSEVAASASGCGLRHLRRP